MKLTDEQKTFLINNKHRWVHSKITHDNAIHPMAKLLKQNFDIRYHPTQINKPTKQFINSHMEPTICQLCILSFEQDNNLYCNVIDRPHTTDVTTRNHQCPSNEPVHIPMK